MPKPLNRRGFHNLIEQGQDAREEPFDQDARINEEATCSGTDSPRGSTARGIHSRQDLRFVRSRQPDGRLTPGTWTPDSDAPEHLAMHRVAQPNQDGESVPERGFDIE